MAHFLLVGADPSKAEGQHPGGVLTLSIGLIDYATRHGHTVKVINTLRSGFVAEPLLSRLASGAGRVFELIGYLLKHRVNGVINFAGSGFSFYERALMSVACRLLRVRDVMVIVDGRFFAVQQAGGLVRAAVRFLLRFPHRLAATGTKWDILLESLGVPAAKRLRVYYWLASDFPVAAAPKPLPAGRPLRMLFVGWLTEAKGVPELLAALAELMPRCGFEFTFIGGGTLLDTVRQAIADNGWQGRVHAPGWVDGDALMHTLDRSDVFVLPSHAEGFPMSLIEAFSRGVPSAVSDVGGVSDSLHDGQNGFLLEPRSVESLVGALQRYLDDPSLIPAHSAAALDVVRRNHDPDQNCRALFDAVTQPPAKG